MFGKIFLFLGILIFLYFTYSNLDYFNSVKNNNVANPKFEINDFFENNIEGWGVLDSIYGSVNSRFLLSIKPLNIGKKSSDLDLIVKMNFDDGEVVQDKFRFFHQSLGYSLLESSAFSQQEKFEYQGNAFNFNFTISISEKLNYFSNMRVNATCSLISKNLALCHANVKKMGFLFGVAYFTLHSLSDEMPLIARHTEANHKK